MYTTEVLRIDDGIKDMDADYSTNALCALDRKISHRDEIVLMQLYATCNILLHAAHMMTRGCALLSTVKYFVGSIATGYKCFGGCKCGRGITSREPASQSASQSASPCPQP